MSGWIYDFRRELESNIWLMPPLYHRVWQWIKYSVNHTQVDIPNRDGSTTTIYPGQRATSYRQIAKGVGYYEGKKWKEPNVKTIKSILDFMVTQSMISIRGNTEGTIVTIEKWELYQSEMIKGNTKRITPATRSKHEVDTNNKGLTNDELMNNEKEAVGMYFEDRLLNETFLEFINHRKQIKKPMSDHAKKLFVGKVMKELETDEQRIYEINRAIMKGWQDIYPEDKKQSLKGLAPATSNLTQEIPEWE